MKTEIKAKWQGNFKDGKGDFSAANSAIDQLNYKHGIKPPGTAVTNPEELMAAAHAACYNMTLSNLLSLKGYTVNSLETTATISSQKNVITDSYLMVDADIENITEDTFQEISKDAKAICPVGNAFNVNIGLIANLNNR